MKRKASKKGKSEADVSFACVTSDIHHFFHRWSYETRNTDVESSFRVRRRPDQLPTRATSNSSFKAQFDVFRGNVVISSDFIFLLFDLIFHTRFNLSCFLPLDSRLLGSVTCFLVAQFCALFFSLFVPTIPTCFPRSFDWPGLHEDVVCCVDTLV